MLRDTLSTSTALLNAPLAAPAQANSAAARLGDGELPTDRVYPSACPRIIGLVSEDIAKE